MLTSLDTVSDILFTTNELAARWNMCPQSLANARSQDRGIPYSKPNGQVRYRGSDILREELQTYTAPDAVAVREAVANVAGLSEKQRTDVACTIIANLLEKQAAA